MKRLFILFVLLASSLPGRAQTILGKSPVDKVLPGFMANNGNANTLIDGVNSNATHGLDGSKIASGTINSNKLDAATLAALGSGGGGGGAATKAETNSPVIWTPLIIGGSGVNNSLTNLSLYGSTFFGGSHLLSDGSISLGNALSLNADGSISFANELGGVSPAGVVTATAIAGAAASQFDAAGAAAAVATAAVSNAIVLSNSVSGYGTIFGPGYNSPNALSNQLQLALWANTTSFSFGSPPTAPFGNPAGTNLMIVSGGLAYTNSGNGGVGLYISNIGYTNGNFRAISTVTFTNFPAKGSFMVGFSTNLSGPPAGNRRLGVQYISTNQNMCFGLMATNSGSAQWFQWMNYSGGDWQIQGCPRGTNFATPGAYTFNVGADSSNFWITVSYPGNSNVMMGTIPITSVLPSSVLLTNLVMGLWGTTNCGTINSAGWRYGSQSINPPDAEGHANYVVFSQDSHVTVGSQHGGDQILIITGAQYNSVTNPAKGVFVVSHGNTGSVVTDVLSTNLTDAFTNDNMQADYFGQFLSNNWIVACYCGDQLTGSVDTWGTTNSIQAVDALLDYLKRNYSFNLRVAYGGSAGGLTMSGYCGTHPGAFDALILNSGGFSITNQYVLGQSNDIGRAFGATNMSVFAAQDPSGFAPSVFYGLPIMCISADADPIVHKFVHTDLLITELGGIVGADSIGTPGLLTPETYDFVVSSALHHGQCYTPAAAAATQAFLNRCAAYTAARRGFYGGSFRDDGSGLTRIPSTAITGGYTTNMQLLPGTTYTLFFTNGILMRTTSP